MRVLILRPEPQASLMAERLRGQAGMVIEIEPMLEVRHEAGVVARILSGGLPAGLLVTSQNAVNALTADPDHGLLKPAILYAVGSRTATAARDAGFERVNDAGGDAADLVDLVARSQRPGDGRLVLVAGRDRSGDIDERLGRLGFTIDIIVAYAAEMRGRLDSAKIAALMDGKIDAVVVASARTAASLDTALTDGGVSGILAHPVLVAISAAAAGPVASRFSRVRIADEPSGEALIEALFGLQGPESN